MLFSKLKKSDRTNIILSFAAAVLAVLFIASFFKTTDRTKKDSVKSAVINEKYKEKITSFSISSESENDENGKIEIVKNDELNGFGGADILWTIQKNGVSIPAEQKTVSSFLNELIKIRNMYKISDKISENLSFFSEKTTLRYFYSAESADFFDVIFGGHDFSGNQRYLMSGRFSGIYETDTSLDVYLNSSVQFWSEPYIISRQVLGNIKNDDIQGFYVKKEGEKVFSKSDFPEKLLELRHGGIAEKLPQKEDESVLELKIELGNKKSIEYKIFKTGNDSFSVLADYGIYTACYKISSWTYKSMSEMML